MMAQVEAAPARNAPCPCGSGRKFKHCHGKTPAQANQPRRAADLLAEGIRLHQANRAAKAADCYRAALAADPQNAQAHYLLALVEAGKGRFEAAATMLSRAVALGLRDAAAHFHYANVLVELGRAEEAIEQFRAAVALKPDFAAASNNLGNVLHELGRYEEAEAQYRATLAHHAENASAWNNLGCVVFQQGRSDDAIACFDRAIHIAPESPDPYVGKARTLEVMNRLDDAREALQESLRRRLNYAPALALLATVERRSGRLAEAIACLDRADLKSLAPVDRTSALGERGTILEELGRYRDAFEAFGIAKRSQQARFGITFDRESAEARLASAEAGLSNLRERAATDDGVRPRPIFVLGFHRSGTTLVERILASHPQIAGAGELAFVQRLEESFAAEVGAPFPAGLASMGDGGALLAAKYRTAYREGLQGALGSRRDADFAVDKHPLNSRYIEFVHWLFPESPIIRVVRHPLSTVLSTYFHNFVDANEWSFDLANAAWFYARIHAHVEHAKRILPLRMMELRYEELVADPERSVRALLEFVGVPWHAACLKFHERREVVRTASYDQVTRPIYTTAIDSYRHYLPWIDNSVMEILTPVMNELGYRLAEDRT